MLAAWLLLVLLLFAPGTVAGQVPGPITPPPVVVTSPLGGLLDLNPRTAPPPTIRSAPDLVLPVPAAEGVRPVKLLDIRPTLSLGEEYSDNFNQSSTDRVSNFRSSLSPGLLAILDGGSLSGQASYTPTAFHDSSQNEAGLNHAFNGLLAWQATPRLKLSVSDTFTQSDEPARNDRLNLRRGRQQFRSNAASLTGDYVFEPFTAQAYYRHSTFSSDTDATTSHTPGGSATMALGQIHLLTLAYEYLHTETTVESSSDSTITPVFGAATSDSTTTGHQVTATFSRELTKDITAGVTGVYAPRQQQMATGRSDFTRKSLTVFSNYVVPEKLIMRSNLGVAQLEGDSSSGRPLLTSNSDITYYLGPAVLGLRIERGFSETFGDGQNFGVVETSSIAGSLVYKFTPLVSVLVSGTYRENKFTGEGGGQAGRDEKTFSATGNVTYQIRRWLGATLDYTYTDTKSSDPLGGYVENRVRAALNATFY